MHAQLTLSGRQLSRYTCVIDEISAVHSFMKRFGVYNISGLHQRMKKEKKRYA